MPREKVTVEVRIETAKVCTERKMSLSEAARRIGVTESTVCDWVTRYKVQGASGFSKQEQNTVYPAEVKDQAVKAYLSGKGSLRKIAARYGLRDTHTLQSWIKVYNSGEYFARKMSGGSRMKQGRQTTQEERIAIVKDCLESGSSFGETAVKYNVSYQQVYTWVKKFKAQGEAGLEDRRGKKMVAQEPRTELEELKIKMAQLEHENYLLRMERDLLKKLDELERGDAFRK